MRLGCGAIIGRGIIDRTGPSALGNLRFPGLRALVISFLLRRFVSVLNENE